MKQEVRQMIKEELNEHYYETVIRPVEEQKTWNEGLDKMYEERWNKQKKAVKNYLKENSPETCKKCYISACLLFDATFGCGYIGKKLKENFEDREEYKIVDSPKGVWDEIFYPMTDEQINNIEAIF
jgi:hypothetical protein